MRFIFQRALDAVADHYDTSCQLRAVASFMGIVQIMHHKDDLARALVIKNPEPEWPLRDFGNNNGGTRRARLGRRKSGWDGTK